jgi:hypothetical protein
MCACLGWPMGATCLSALSLARTDRVYTPERARTRRHRATTRARLRCPGMPSRRSRPAPCRGHPAAQRIAAPRRSGAAQGHDPPRHRHAQRQAKRGPEIGIEAGAAAILDHHSDHHCTLIGLVRHCSPSFRMPLDLCRWTPANYREAAADGWGSRGRRFKSCQPDTRKRRAGAVSERSGAAPASFSRSDVAAGGADHDRAQGAPSGYVSTTSATVGMGTTTARPDVIVSSPSLSKRRSSART